MNSNNYKKRKTGTKKNNAGKGFGMLALFAVVAVVIAILTSTLSSPGKEPSRGSETGYTVKIKEIGSDALLAHSENKELGLGEILIEYDEQMIVQDINGQIIDRAELHVDDRIEVLILPLTKDEDGIANPPVAHKMILLPDDSDDYV